MLELLLLSVPMAFIWIVVTASISVGSFFVGYVLGFAILTMLKAQNLKLDWRRLPDQLTAFFVYVVTLGRDIILSSVDVARRVINPSLPLNPGIISVPTQDSDESEAIAAFSAHGITITPGELVVDFKGSHTMYVHCLDVEASSKTAEQAQTKRLHLLRRIMGR